LLLCLCYRFAARHPPLLKRRSGISTSRIGARPTLYTIGRIVFARTDHLKVLICR
jgi:hypothetical protein